MNSSTSSLFSFVIVLGLLAYLLTASVVAGFYHDNDSLLVFLSRLFEYLKLSFLGFGLSMLIGGLLFKKPLSSAKGGPLLVWAIVCCLVVSFLTAFLFFVVSIVWMNEGSFIDQLTDGALLIYMVQVSGLGVLYSLPVVVIFAVLLTVIIKKHRRK